MIPVEKNILAIIQKYSEKPVKRSNNIYRLGKDIHAPVNLSFELEKVFHIEFEEYEWNSIKTVRGVIELVLFKIENTENSHTKGIPESTNNGLKQPITICQIKSVRHKSGVKNGKF